MRIGRLLRHLLAALRGVDRVFPVSIRQEIEAAIAASETRHGGELRVAVEASLGGEDLWRGIDARERALALFAELGVWDTAANSGVLVYVLLADHAVEIVADRGHAAIGPARWEALCHRVETHFARGDWRQGALEAVAGAGELMAETFPPDGRANELADRVVAL